MARPFTYGQPKSQVGLRIPDTMLERLRAESEARDLSVNLLITRAITAYLNALTPAEEP